MSYIVSIVDRSGTGSTHTFASFRSALRAYQRVNKRCDLWASLFGDNAEMDGDAVIDGLTDEERDQL
jgi:hypothetical protein